MLLAGCALHAPRAGHADPFRFDSRWDYQQSGGDRESQWTFDQSHNLNLNKSLSAGTEFSGNVRYNDSRQSVTGDSQRLTPSASLDVRSDLFALNLNGTTAHVQIEGRPDTATTSWNANWFSLLPDWPQLRLIFGQSFTADEQNPRGQDSESTNWGVNLQHDFGNLKLLYDFRSTTSEDNIANRLDDYLSHLGQVQYSRSFLDGTLGVSASGQMNYLDARTREDTVLGMVRFVPLSPAAVGGALASEDDTPAEGALATRNELSDQDLTTGVVEILQSGAAANLGLKVNFEPVNRIDVILGGVLADVDRNQLVWEAYASNDNFFWAQVAGVAVVYVDKVVNGSLQTVAEITLRQPGAEPLAVDFLKVVVRSPGAPAIIGTIQAAELQAGLASVGTGLIETSSTESLQLLSSLGITFRPTVQWSLGYHFNHSYATSDPGLDRWQLTQSLNGSYAVQPDLSFTVAVNESRYNTSGQDERINRTYSASTAASPLSALDVSLGYTRSDSTAADKRDQSVDTVTANAAARLFPDLSSTISGIWTRSESFISDTQSVSFTGRIETAARLSPKLNIDADFEYSPTSTTSAGEGETNDVRIVYGTDVSYRPSDLLLTHVAFDRNIAEDSSLLTGNLSLRITPKIQISGNFSRELASQKANTYGALLNWAISHHFSLDNSYVYQSFAGTDIWSSFVRLSANF